MSNIAGKAYGMNVITPVPPHWTWVQRLIFMAARAFPATLSGLLRLNLIHFARWVLIKRNQWPEGDRGKPELQYDYMLFCSNFNGTWDQYIDAFSDGIPQGLDLFWYASVKYPLSIPVSPFKSYIVRNQFHNGYYYNATPGSAQRDIKAALKVFAKLKELEALHKDHTAQQFASVYNKALVAVQNCLGSPGYAPIASLDTENADIHRAAFLSNAGDARSMPTPVGQTKVGGAPKRQPPGNTFDGGHCFLTVLMPINTCEVVSNSGMRISPVHRVRDLLATLPTAHQSPATDSITKSSPFAQNTRTHFVRMAVLDDVIFNGRSPTNTLIDALFQLVGAGRDRTTPDIVDHLPCPYLLLAIDCDADDEESLRGYLREIWLTMCADLEPIFRNCFRFCEDVNSADSFVDYVLGRRIATTMPFNDYWAQTPTLPSLSVVVLVLTALASGVLAFAALYFVLYALNGIQSPGAGSDATLAVLATAAGLLAAYLIVMTRGSRSFPAASNADLKSILKALYLQRALIRFAIDKQDIDPAHLYSAFGEFLTTVRVSDTSAPTQPAGIIPALSGAR